MASMTHAAIKSLFGITALGLSAIAISACGNEVPSGAVAKVGDESITQEEFDKWFDTIAKGQAAQTGGAVPDPPDYKKCVAAKKKQPAPQGQKKQTDAALKKQCESEYDALKDQAMQIAVNATWIEQEAEKQDVKVSDAEIRRVLEDEKKKSFPNDKGDKQYKQFLKTSGMTEQDVLDQIKLQTLQQKLTEKITADAKKVSDKDVQEYYEKNKNRFAQPETRDLLVVLSKTKAKAEAAKRALEDGQSWKQVTKRYSIDEASKAQGGKQPAVAEGQSEKALDEAIFAAEKGALEGPVKTQFGWQVFEVSKITPASQQTLEESKDTIKNLLRAERQKEALDDFVKDFRKDYKEATECAEDFRISECNNAPKEKTGTGPASGGSPPGGAPQQQQQQAPAPQTPQE
jgi:foldase protein PrsA